MAADINTEGPIACRGHSGPSLARRINCEIYRTSPLRDRTDCLWRSSTLFPLLFCLFSTDISSNPKALSALPVEDCAYSLEYRIPEVVRDMETQNQRGQLRVHLLLE